MTLKIIAGILAAALLAAFVAPPILKLQETPLTVVILIGFVMMLVDLWQSLQSKED